MIWLGLFGGVLCAAGGFIVGLYVGALSARMDVFDHDYRGDHAWTEWSEPYGVKGYGWYAPTEWWQERKCQCGNRDFRRAP